MISDVSNLDARVTDVDLYDYFIRDDVTPIWAEVSKDPQTGKSLCKGYVCFHNHHDAGSAINQVTVEIDGYDEDCNMEDCLRKYFRSFGNILLITLYTDNNANLCGFIA
ncbi:hypothetical protein OROMI_014651 [Orobanche minor]